MIKFIASRLSLLTRETLLFQDKMKWNEILQTCGSDEMDSYPLSINSPLLWQLPVWSHNVTTLILSQLSSTNKTSTAKQVLGNCERMALANFIGNRQSTFILWIWMSTCKFYFCTVVLCYQTYLILVASNSTNSFHKIFPQIIF